MPVFLRLEEMAGKHPNKNYLLFGDEAYTYKDMNDWVNRMTRALSESGVKEDDQVFFPRSPMLF